jgi:hypothetical protein
MRCELKDTEFAKVFDIWQQNILVELFAVFDWEQNRVQFTNCANVIRCQGRE